MSLKRWLSSGNLNGELSPKKQCLEDDNSTDNNNDAGGDPETIVTWNVNSLVRRAESNSNAINTFVKTHTPDVICLQEVRMPANGANKTRYARRNKQEIGDAAAVDRLCRTAFAEYIPYFALAEQKKSGTCLLIHKKFKPKTIEYSIDPKIKFEPEGRVTMVEFQSYWLLNTYTPNNGWTSPAFKRRKEWDDQIKTFLMIRKSEPKPLVYVGDLNCAPTDKDLSHPQYFRKVLMQGVPRPPDLDRGQPGCAENERIRFRAICDAADLVDAYRIRNPQGPSNADEPCFTWRGGEGKYFGKGMRIDHTLVSSRLLEYVESVSILGKGAQREGFMGSDHCPLMLTLKNMGGNNVETQSAQQDQNSSTSQQQTQLSVKDEQPYSAAHNTTGT